MKEPELYVVIVGCGRLGSRVASELSGAGHSVVVVDRNEATFGKLSWEFGGFRVEGDATEMETLRSAKVGRADLVIAATREDNVNLFVAQVARRVFGVERVVARLHDPARQPVFAALGVETICPTLTAVEAFLARAGTAS